MLKIFANLGFRWKIALPIVLLALLILLMGGLSLQGVKRLATDSEQLSNRYLPAISLLLNADRDLYQAFVSERSLLDESVGERAAELRRSHQENLDQAEQRVRRYAEMRIGAEAERQVAEFHRHFAAWKATSARVVALGDSEPEAASRLSFGESARQFEALRLVIDQLGEREDGLASARGEQAVADGQRMVWQLGGMIGLGLLLCLLLVIAMPLLITRPLQRLLGRLEQIADGDGDLRGRLDVSSGDELGRLGRAFNRFLDKLQPLIGEVGQVTGEVADSARGLAEMAVLNDRLIGDEHQSIDQVSTAATEMSTAIHEVARNAQDTADAAREAERNSREGGRVVGDTVAAIRQLAEEVEAASDSIQHLETEAQNIGAVLAVIRGIAEQTNLLALNAAIEAARAGEQGRGFAVVADEVRALAARTQDSTKDIQAMIERLQSGVSEAVQAMHNGSSRARDSVERAADVEQALGVTGESIQRINDMAAQIASACEEQSSVTEEIARNISEIRDLSNEAAKTSEQSSDASRRLSELSTRLSRLVGRFQA